MGEAQHGRGKRFVLGFTHPAGGASIPPGECGGSGGLGGGLDGMA